MSRAAVSLAGVLTLLVATAAAPLPTSTPASAATSPLLPKHCTKQAPSRIAPNDWPPTQTELAPAGASAIRLCRYGGLNADPPSKLERSALDTTPSIVGEIIRDLDHLPSMSGVFSCPDDTGAEIVVLLAYADQNAVTISVGLSGCATVTNGNLIRTASGSPSQAGPQLVAELKHLTGSHQ